MCKIWKVLSSRASASVFTRQTVPLREILCRRFAPNADAKKLPFLPKILEHISVNPRMRGVRATPYHRRCTSLNCLFRSITSGGRRDLVVAHSNCIFNFPCTSWGNVEFKTMILFVASLLGYADMNLFCLSMATALAVIPRQKVLKKRLGCRIEGKRNEVRIGSAYCIGANVIKGTCLIIIGRWFSSMVSSVWDIDSFEVETLSKLS